MNTASETSAPGTALAPMPGDPRDALVETAGPMFPARRQAEHINAGTVEIESQRAIAEAQGKLVIAQKFPRNVNYAHAAIMEACRYKSLAEDAFYAYKRGGENVSGPSIRLAEELARCWGNVEYGIRELSSVSGPSGGVSEMEAYCWDLQTNTVSSQKFTVRHIRDVKDGGKALTSQRDIYELTANMGGRRQRARILAIMPKWLVAEAVEECRKTLAGDNSIPVAERIRKMVSAFAKYGVTPQHIEAKTGKKLDAMLADDLVDLQGIFTSLKDGNSSASDWFEMGAKGNAILDQAGGPAAPKPPAAPAPAPASPPAPLAEARTAPPEASQESPAPTRTAQAPKPAPATAPEQAPKPAAKAAAPKPAPAPAQQQPPAGNEPPPADEGDMF